MRAEEKGEDLDKDQQMLCCRDADQLAFRICFRSVKLLKVLHGALIEDRRVRMSLHAFVLVIRGELSKRADNWYPK